VAGVLDFWERHSPTELLLLIELVRTWWKREELPFPSIKTLAAVVFRIGRCSEQWAI
jgi:hypothetical protein